MCVCVCVSLSASARLCVCVCAALPLPLPLGVRGYFASLLLLLARHRASQELLFKSAMARYEQDLFEAAIHDLRAALESDPPPTNLTEV